MSNSPLPERASLEYLKKLAKDRLAELRRTDPQAKLATALLAVAREHGFSSWRALKAEVDRRQANDLDGYFEACGKGDIEQLQALLAKNPGLVREEQPNAPHHGWTGLHSAAQQGHVEAVRLLLGHGANPNAREEGDNTYPLHWAAAGGHRDILRALLDAGGDVHGFGDVHELDVIGWATVWRADGDIPPEPLALLIERGARHHIFSAIAAGDLGLIQKLVEENPQALDRRLSRFERGQTPLHFAIGRRRYDILDLLIELGADLEATDKHGQTALEAAILHADREAIDRLYAAGAKHPEPMAPSNVKAGLESLAGSVRKGVPMIYVPDVARALDWYAGIGFTEIARYGDDGQVNFGMLSFGKAELMLNMHGKPGPHDVSLWFYTDRVDDLYRHLKSRQFAAAQAALAGRPGGAQGIEFEQDIDDMFYGARQFGIRDLNGYILYFIQET